MKSVNSLEMNETNSVAVNIQSLTKLYGTKTVLNSIDLKLSRGTIYGLIGRNGSGKSTLMNIISGEERSTSGIMELCPDIKLGLVSSKKGYPSFISLKGICSLFKASHKTWDESRYYSILDIFKLAPELKYGQLSWGQAAGVKLAVMLAQKPALWLLDEATLGIDIISQGYCLTALLEYYIEDQPCVLFCTHTLSEIERLADEILILEEGEIYWQGDKDKLISKEESFSETIFNIFNELEGTSR